MPELAEHTAPLVRGASGRAIPTVLCVDDDLDVSRAIGVLLSSYHVQTLCDCSGAQGIWDALRLKPDLIITDLRMENGTGEDLLSTIRGNEQTRHIPVIVLTGKPGSHLPGELRKRGANGFLRKPADHAALLSEIGAFIPLRPRRAEAAAPNNHCLQHGD